ncbi:MAG TPA: hypothetical protein VMD56_13245 [Steroidobacteraceae bacterium]|nr:hypothetical protein [Steroidobacteraceae bacterium]
MKPAGMFKAGVLLGLYALTSLLAGCVVAGPREGYYDRANHRWWHNHAWVVCAPGDFHCR